MIIINGRSKTRKPTRTLAKQRDVTEIKIAQAEIKSEVKDLKEQVRDMKGTQKNQIWALITLLGGSLITVSLRALFSNNP
ncbi:MAG: hypothetical protein GPI93_21250 [Microcystis aeruginosa LG13-12]|nr:hypothetical protein [Microcystis aeruginosa LG13-12]